MATCLEPIRLVPGPQGPAGDDGVNGVNGTSSFTTTTANFTMPAIAATAIASVVASGGFVIGQAVHLQNAGTLIVTALPSAITITLQNPAGYAANVAGGTIIATGSKLGPSGVVGPAGTNGTNGAGATVAILGDLQTHDGAASTNLAKGTNGQILTTDTTAATDLRWQTVVPNASATTDNLIVIANTPLGTETPGPLQFLATLKATDTGAVQTVGGNARGIDAVDLQPARALITQVASGLNSTISGGRNNTASAADSSVGGGGTNVASGSSSRVGGGSSNTASNTNSFIGGGNANTASAVESAVVGGFNNLASGVDAFIGGGANNIASSGASAVLAGGNNTASGPTSAVAAGSNNIASGQYSFVGAGILNTTSADYSSVVGGVNALADKYGQRAHASGAFVTQGDAQYSELSWKRETTNATVNVELFLDGAGATQRAIVGNNTTWTFSILVVGRSSTGVSASWKIEGGILNNAGAVALIAAVTTTALADGTGGTWGLAANVVVDADDPNNALRIRVTGVAATTIRWHAVGRLTELSY